MIELFQVPLDDGPRRQHRWLAARLRDSFERRSAPADAWVTEVEIEAEIEPGLRREVAGLRRSELEHDVAHAPTGAFVNADSGGVQRHCTHDVLPAIDAPTASIALPDRETSDREPD